jgi:hypothetical protein
MMLEIFLIIAVLVIIIVLVIRNLSGRRKCLENLELFAENYTIGNKSMFKELLKVLTNGNAKDYKSKFNKIDKLAMKYNNHALSDSLTIIEQNSLIITLKDYSLTAKKIERMSLLSRVISGESKVEVDLLGILLTEDGMEFYERNFSVFSYLSERYKNNELKFILGKIEEGRSETMDGWNSLKNKIKKSK